MFVSSRNILKKLLELADDDLRRKIKSLNDDERKVFEYFLSNISVGTIIALRELTTLYRVRNAKDVLRTLTEKGLLERGSGCYSLSPQIRTLLFKVYRELI